MTLHDWETCWFCRANRIIVIVAMSLMATVCFVGSAWDLVHRHWLVAGREFLGVPVCLGMLWLTLKALTLLNRGFDWLFNKIEAKLQ